ncbi:DUF2497 domain-containing protein [Stakelama sp. CBK3Z-3]|uniref:DUF2497 domain-containing protein n=1 Tax=Stakelama flava TaxID=2860338 RepID=A0ABS6XKT3_9SPHN|nr:DUF2497 domain-containing protein [Stakelama flava]MBW4330819.1 DUF2497 domain-containing protein [Stakelama flava]
MGDISNETSMEDILSSIKRIIAEEGESALTRASRKPRRTSVEQEDKAEGRQARDPAEAVLELREAVAGAESDAPYSHSAGGRESGGRESPGTDGEASMMRPDREQDRTPPDPHPAAEPQPVKQTSSIDVTTKDDDILSHQTAAASRGQLETLSRLIVKPDIAGSDTLEGLVREMLRPMLREWLDANLPTMVERMVQREIARITERGG